MTLCSMLILQGVAVVVNPMKFLVDTIKMVVDFPASELLKTLRSHHDHHDHHPTTWMSRTGS